MGKLIDKCIKDYKEVVVMNKHVMEQTRETILICWQYPKKNFVKLNVNGASSKDGLLGCGGCFRDDNGDWLGGS